MPARCPHDLRKSCEDLLDDTMVIKALASICLYRQRSLPDTARQAPDGTPRRLLLLFRSRAPCRLISKGHANRGPPSRVCGSGVGRARSSELPQLLIPLFHRHLWFERSYLVLAMHIDLRRVPLPAAQTVRILHELTIRGFGGQLVTRCG